MPENPGNVVLLPRLFEFEMVQRQDLRESPALRNLLAQLKLSATFLPVALRWRVSGELGLPRVPFAVWRRERTNAPSTVSLGTPQIMTAGPNRIARWNQPPLFELQFQCTPNANETVICQALDEHMQPIPGERVAVNAALSGRRIRLRAPNIAALRFTNNGQITDLSGITMQAFANSGGWALVERVGLPVNANEITAPAYDSSGQGIPSAALSGVNAALNRLNIGNTLFTPPPTSVAGTGLAPTWPVPTPAGILNDLRTVTNAPIPILISLLQGADPNNANQLQNVLQRSVQIAGMHQPEIEGQTEDATANLNLIPLLLISAATDYWSALALGFGTTDFAPSGSASRFLEPATQAMPAFDYMVTAPYTLPFGLQMTIAALATPAHFAPPAPVEMAVGNLRRNRPPARDQASSEDTEITWQRPAGRVTPHAYAVAAALAGGTFVVLNELRAGTNSFMPYIPARRADGAGGLTDEATVSFIATRRPVPLTGMRIEAYVAAALDVFGRWSNWANSIGRAINADAVGIPRILDAHFEQAETNKGTATDLVIDLLWDWADRSPKKIEFAGVFFDTTPPTTVPVGVARRPNDTFVTNLAITSTGDTPGIPLPHSVSQLSAGPDDEDARKYRVRIKGFKPAFTNSNRVEYALYARAVETINPTLFGSFSAPRIVQLDNPKPLSAPSLQPALVFTALPDATGQARTRLNFGSPVTGAVGYALYGASETALRALAGLPDVTPNMPLTTRRDDLISVVQTNAKARDKFTRVNTALLPTPEADISLNGQSTSLYAYQMTSFTDKQVESAPSAPLIVAVSHIAVPAIPQVNLRRVGTAPSMLCITSNGQVSVGKIALYSTHESVYAGEIGLMGPPVEEIAVADMPFELTVAPTLPADWRPYYVRAVAIGVEDEDQGQFAGESEGSSTVEIFIPPAGNPNLDQLAQAVFSGTTFIRVTVRSTADRRRSPVGSHRLEFMTRNSIPDSTGRMNDKTVAAANLPNVNARPSAFTAAPGVIFRATLGTVGGVELNEYETFIPVSESGPTMSVIARMIDPLGRLTDIRIPLPTPAPASNLSGTTPAPTPVTDLTHLIVKAAKGKVQISVRSAEPIKKPAIGEYVLELSSRNEGQRKEEAILKTPLHLITTTAAPGQFARTKTKDDYHRYNYKVTLAQIFDPTTVYIVRLTGPKKKTTELRSQ